MYQSRNGLLFSWWRTGDISWHLKPMPVIFLFNTDHDFFLQHVDFYWNPCLVRKWANSMKACIIFVPTPNIHQLWYNINTIKIIKYKHVPIDFVRKDWEYLAHIFGKCFPWTLKWIIYTLNHNNYTIVQKMNLSDQQTFNMNHIYIHPYLIWFYYKE